MASNIKVWRHGQTLDPRELESINVDAASSQPAAIELCWSATRGAMTKHCIPTTLPLFHLNRDVTVSSLTAGGPRVLMLKLFVCGSTWSVYMQLLSHCGPSGLNGQT